MATDPAKKPTDPDQGVEDVLSGFNAAEILEDPDDLDSDDDRKPEPAATPDSPNPI
jgi:hypothetical protein